MQVVERKNEEQCMGKRECEREVKIEINLGKTRLLLCKNCADKLYKALGSKIVPKSIKSKFYN